MTRQAEKHRLRAVLFAAVVSCRAAESAAACRETRKTAIEAGFREAPADRGRDRKSEAPASEKPPPRKTSAHRETRKPAIEAGFREAPADWGSRPNHTPEKTCRRHVFLTGFRACIHFQNKKTCL